MTEAFVEGIDVARRFQQGDVMLDALQPASFTVHAGDRIAIVGPSGSGKSTLLQIIADLDTATSGQVRWPALGISGALRPRHIGIVFQSASLIPTLSAAENVEVPLRLLGSQSEPRQSAMKALDSVGLRLWLTSCPTSCPAGRRSASAWRAPSPCVRVSCWPMNPPASLTSRPRSSLWTPCCARSRARTPPLSSPRTIRPSHSGCRLSGAWTTAC